MNLRRSTALSKSFILHRSNDVGIEKDRQSWRRKPIKLWSTIEIMYWIQSVAKSKKLNYEEIQMHNFSDVTGSKLDGMQRQGFLERDRTFGAILYDELQRHQNLGNRSVEKVEEKFGKRSRGRPPGSKQDKTSKTKKPHCRLWEFLLDLLSSPEYCPSMITWENQDEGLFKIVQSEKVAKLWGDARGNKNMDYAKMTRLMRYYYHTKMLEHVKQRLVYRFGPNAPWKTKQYYKQEF